MNHGTWQWMLIAKDDEPLCNVGPHTDTLLIPTTILCLHLYLIFRNESMEWAERMPLQKIYLPRTCQCDRFLTWKRDFCRYN